MAHLRSPICAVVGHVDHGKSSLLDFIRQTNIVASEAGAITQSIGASIVPLSVIKEKCGDLLKKLNMDFTIPGLLFIDTPGHAAFTNLRKRGGSLADIAIVVVDINEGFKPQTIEAIEILKSYKTPFVVALNKVDLVPGFKLSNKPIIACINDQSESVKQYLEQRLYEIVGQLHDNFGLVSERFDRVSNYTQEVALIPVSAKFGLGVSAILMVLSALAQKYMEARLSIEETGYAKGTILEVKDEKGIGIAIDVILYSGTLKTNDVLVIGGLEKPIVTKVRGLFQPQPLTEMRDLKNKFKSVKEVVAATGVKITAPDLKNVIAGMPIRSCDKKDIDLVSSEIQKEIDEVVVETDDIGIVVKADTIGSLEALVKLLREHEILIRRAHIGNISKKDICEAESNIENDPLLGVIVGFNVGLNPEAKETLAKSPVTILTDKIIYALIDKYKKYKEDKQKELESKELENVTRPCKIKILEGYTFRQSNPAIVGVEVFNGIAKTGMRLMNSQGEHITFIKIIQKDKENVSSTPRNTQVAMSLPNVTVGRQINESDWLYSDLSENEFRVLKKLKNYLTSDEVDAIKEIANIKRENNPVWGV